MEVLVGILEFIGFVVLVMLASAALGSVAPPEDDEVEEALGLIAGNWDRIRDGR